MIPQSPERLTMVEGSGDWVTDLKSVIYSANVKPAILVILSKFKVPFLPEDDLIFQLCCDL